MPRKSPEAIARKNAYMKKWREENSNYHSEYRKNNRASFKIYDKIYLQSNREKVYARQAVAYAIRTGKLVRPEVCSRCSSSVDIQADHADYAKPLEVTWLCRQCHLDIGGQRKTLMV